MLAEPRTDPCDSPSFVSIEEPGAEKKRSGGVRGGCAPPRKIFLQLGSRRGQWTGIFILVENFWRNLGQKYWSKFFGEISVVKNLGRKISVKKFGQKKRSKVFVDIFRRKFSSKISAENLGKKSWSKILVENLGRKSR